MPTTARQSPVGLHLIDGFSTKVAFAAKPDVSFWERSVKPLGVVQGDAIDVTTMHNQQWRTKAPRKLKDSTEVTGTAAYDPKVLTQIIDLIGVNGWITIHFPDNSSWDFVGYLRSFEPGEHQEGELPTASYTIVVTNRLNDGTEASPVYNAPP